MDPDFGLRRDAAGVLGTGQRDGQDVGRGLAGRWGVRAGVEGGHYFWREEDEHG